MIVLISAVNQAVILKELTWQSSATSAVGRFARDRSLDRPLSLSALALVAADNPNKRAELEESLRNAILDSQQKVRGASSSGDALSGARRDLGARCSRLLQEAETHRLAATESAASLLTLFAGKDATRPQTAESSPYIRRIVDEEQAAALAVGEAAQASAAQSTDHVDRLNNSEFLLFGLVLLVLMLEGLFVINPAVLRIQRFMDDLRQSHAELEGLRREIGAEQQ